MPEEIEREVSEGMAAIPPTFGIAYQGDGESFTDFFQRFDSSFSRWLSYNPRAQEYFMNKDGYILVLTEKLNLKWARLLVGWISDTIKWTVLAPEEIFRAGRLLELWENEGFATYQWSGAIYEPLLTWTEGEQKGPFPVWSVLRTCFEHQLFD